MNMFIGQLKVIFEDLNQTHYNGGIINPVITVQKEKTKSKNKITLGWCSVLPKWTRIDNDKETHHHEINIVIDYIDRSTKEVLSTFVHECAHCFNLQNGIIDTNRKQYHSDKFQIEAQKLGLLVEKTDRGWSQTSLSDELWQHYQDLNEQGILNFDYLTFKKVVEPEKEKKPSERKPVFTYKCPHCSSEIKSKNDKLQAKCKDCDEDFYLVEK